MHSSNLSAEHCVSLLLIVMSTMEWAWEVARRNKTWPIRQAEYVRWGHTESVCVTVR